MRDLWTAGLNERNQREIFPRPSSELVFDHGACSRRLLSPCYCCLKAKNNGCVIARPSIKIQRTNPSSVGRPSHYLFTRCSPDIRISHTPKWSKRPLARNWSRRRHGGVYFHRRGIEDRSIEYAAFSARLAARTARARVSRLSASALLSRCRRNRSLAIR